MSRQCRLARQVGAAATVATAVIGAATAITAAAFGSADDLADRFALFRPAHDRHKIEPGEWQCQGVWMALCALWVVYIVFLQQEYLVKVRSTPAAARAGV